MRKKRVREVSIDKLANGGDGIGHLPDGRVVFVRGGVPGDVVEIEIEKEKKSWARGRVISIDESSPARQPVECDAFQKGCGGCRFWGVQYERELQWKVEACAEAIERIGGVQLPDFEVNRAPSIRDYRSRVTLHQRRDGRDLRLGFFAAESRRVVDVERCPVARPAIDEAIAELGGPLSMLGNAEISIETAGDGKAVVLVRLGRGQRVRRDHLEELSRRIEQGIVVTGVEILDDQDKYFIIGDTTVDAAEVIADPPVPSMRIKPGRFRQANRAVNRLLVDHVRERICDLESRPKVVELFCGSGNFSFSLAPYVEGLMGFEVSEDAIEVARQMSGLAEWSDRLSFEVADLTEERVLDRIATIDFDLLLLDPPRQGADQVARRLADVQGIDQIIYVSCDPACLARDLQKFDEARWNIDSLAFFDLFPRTPHLEAVVGLKR